MSFYVTLPSDSSMSYFPGNTTSKFRTYLPESVKLQGPYEVALAEISYPHTWNNMSQSYILSLYSAAKPIGYSRIIELPAGYYGNIEDLLEQLNYDEDEITNDETIKNDIFDAIAPTSPKYEFSYIARLRRVVVSVKPNYMLTIPGLLAVMLGFTKDFTTTITVAQIRTATYPVDLDVGLHSLFIYSDIVESRAVGDFHVPLLRIASVQGKDGDTVDREFVRPHYLPVSANTFQSIEINVMSEMGVPVRFERGKVHATLHFRPRRMWTPL